MPKDKTNTSQRWFWYFAIAFMAVFTFVVLDLYVLNDVIDDVRRGQNGPEVLFEGEKSLWVPTSWAEFWWFKAKPLIFVPFVVFGLLVACWHEWEEGRNKH